jgi:hypothetical protein
MFAAISTEPSNDAGVMEVVAVGLYVDNVVLEWLSAHTAAIAGYGSNWDDTCDEEL